jgi:hypothetical protein
VLLLVAMTVLLQVLLLLQLLFTSRTPLHGVAVQRAHA